MQYSSKIPLALITTEYSNRVPLVLQLKKKIITTQIGVFI